MKLVYSKKNRLTIHITSSLQKKAGQNQQQKKMTLRKALPSPIHELDYPLKD